MPRKKAAAMPAPAANKRLFRKTCRARGHALIVESAPEHYKPDHLPAFAQSADVFPAMTTWLRSFAAMARQLRKLTDARVLRIFEHFADAKRSAAKKKKPAQSSLCGFLMMLVGARGFEPPTTCTPCRSAIARKANAGAGFRE